MVRSPPPRSAHLIPVAIAAALLAPACSESDGVVVYTALDRPFSERIFRLFTDRTGIPVRAVYDTESTKTVGLVERIRAERRRPMCDVFWNNEILHTLLLEKEGLLAEYAPKRAKEFPEAYRDPDGRWHGFAARARILLVNTDLVPPEHRPRSIRDLGDPRWRGRTGIAKPLFGTTASHVACLFAALGEEEATRLLSSLRENDVRVYGGNKGCAEAVGAGHIAFGLTDTDDAMIEVEAGRPVVIVYPDAQEGGMGTLFLPNTLAILADAPHPETARTLVEFLLSPEVEEILASGPSAQIPLHPEARVPDRVESPRTVRPMELDLDRAAAAFTAARDAVEAFLR